MAGPLALAGAPRPAHCVEESVSRAELAARFEAILAREGAALRRVTASYAADSGRREDLFQDICLALWTALPRFRGEASERTFVFRVAHNRGIAAAARRGLATAELDAAEEVADRGPDPAAAAEQRQRQASLQQAVRRLPLGLRQALALALEGFSYREIGEVMGISEGNVAVRVTRARKALRELLGEERRSRA